MHAFLCSLRYVVAVFPLYAAICFTTYCNATNLCSVYRRIALACSTLAHTHKDIVRRNYRQRQKQSLFSFLLQRYTQSNDSNRAHSKRKIFLKLANSIHNNLIVSIKSKCFIDVYGVSFCVKKEEKKLFHESTSKMGKQKKKASAFSEFMFEFIEKERRAGRRYPKVRK